VLGPERLVLYVDIAGTLAQLQLHEPVPGLSPEQLMTVQLMARVAAAQLGALRDAWLVVAPAPEGISARFRVNLL
jgi:hypothetical protein